MSLGPGEGNFPFCHPMNAGSAPSPCFQGIEAEGREELVRRKEGRKDL